MFSVLWILFPNYFLFAENSLNLEYRMLRWSSCVQISSVRYMENERTCQVEVVLEMSNVFRDLNHLKFLMVVGLDRNIYCCKINMFQDIKQEAGLYIVLT